MNGIATQSRQEGEPLGLRGEGLGSFDCDFARYEKPGLDNRKGLGS